MEMKKIVGVENRKKYGMGVDSIFCRPAINFIMAWITVLMRTQFV